MGYVNLHDLYDLYDDIEFEESLKRTDEITAVVYTVILVGVVLLNIALNSLV